MCRISSPATVPHAAGNHHWSEASLHLLSKLPFFAAQSRISWAFLFDAFWYYEPRFYLFVFVFCLHLMYEEFRMLNLSFTWISYGQHCRHNHLHQLVFVHCKAKAFNKTLFYSVCCHSVPPSSLPTLYFCLFSCISVNPGFSFSFRGGT